MLTVAEAIREFRRRAATPGMYATNRREFVQIALVILQMTGKPFPVAEVFDRGLTRYGSSHKGGELPADKAWAQNFSNEVIGYFMTRFGPL